jgi:hypothetical protein
MKTTALDLYHVDNSEARQRKSKAWFDDKIKAMDSSRVTPNSIMTREGSLNLTSRLIPGKLYAYYYTALNKNTLPYYDQFPLVFPFSKTNETFHGLNMHYLDYQMRFALFNELLKISKKTTINETSKLQFHWETIRGVSNLAPAQACVKQYRFDHVRSQFLEISPKDWATALLLPLARFSGSNQKAVWQESKRTGRSW